MVHQCSLKKMSDFALKRVKLIKMDASCSFNNDVFTTVKSDSFTRMNCLQNGRNPEVWIPVKCQM